MQKGTSRIASESRKKDGINMFKVRGDIMRITGSGFFGSLGLIWFFEAGSPYVVQASLEQLCTQAGLELMATLLPQPPKY